MLSSAADALPERDGWQFEPKWDGFRALVFRDGDELVIQSRDEKPLNRYFPEIDSALRATLPERCALDGEIVLVRKGGLLASDGAPASEGTSALDFEALQLRLHPAASRVKLLAEQ